MVYNQNWSDSEIKMPAPERENLMMYDLQKASMWKRISAFLFDAILLGIVAVLFAWCLSTTLGYDRYSDALDAAYARYGEMYGVNLNLSLTEYDALTPQEVETLNTAYAAMTADEEAVHAYNMIISLTLLITSLGILAGFVVMEWIIPLKLGNGQTLGKKIFGIGLMRQDGVKVNGKILFIRTILGKYTMETMAPVLIVMMIWFGILGLAGTLVLAGLGLVQALMLIFSKRRLVIHDALAATVAIDVGSQMIFDSREAMIAYKEKIHAEQAARAAY